MDQDLRSIQAWFATAITHGDAVDEGIAVAARTHGTGEPERLVTAGPRMSARERLGVYHAAYRARLVECLADDYPAVQHALGPGDFEDVCKAYIARHPSRSFSLNAFGASMPELLADHLGPSGAALVDLARLEWAIVEVIHAPEAPPLDASRLTDLAGDEWGALRLVPSRALRVLRLRYPVNAYYQAFREGQPGILLPPATDSVTAVFLRDLCVWRMEVALSIAPALERLIVGSTLEDALAGTEGTADVVGAAFRQWIGSGLFVGAVRAVADGERRE